MKSEGFVDKDFLRPHQNTLHGVVTMAHKHFFMTQLNVNINVCNATTLYWVFLSTHKAQILHVK